MESAFTIFASIGVVFSVMMVFAGIEKLVQYIKNTIASRPRKDPKLPDHWKRNVEQKLLNKPYVYVVRDDGAYIRIEREFKFLTFIWEDQGVGAFVSHWNKKENRQDLTLSGNFYDAIDKADTWFPMGRDVTQNHKEEFWVAHNKERRAEANA